MATIEERLARIEQEHAALKEKIELQTIAIGALVTMDARFDAQDKKFDQIMLVLNTLAPKPDQEA
jgi:hypothetical protein